MRWWPFSLKNEARLEAYDYFHNYIHPLPKNARGEFDEFSGLFMDNDVDAFRHAYVSGRFTHEYGAGVAELFGNLNEIIRFGSSISDSDEAKNMDLWNNAVGRTHGLRTRKRETLLKSLHGALESRELIADLKDERIYRGPRSHRPRANKHVIVLKQNKTGRNEFFYDLVSNRFMTLAEFVSAIERNEYPGYRIIVSHGVPTPVSKTDGDSSNNLG